MIVQLGGCKKVAIISDVHANATALRAVLGHVGDSGVDAVLMLGDLLGYGPDVKGTCTLMDEWSKRFEVRMVRGNHDQICMELEQGHSPYLSNLSDWIRESSMWTASQIDQRLSERYSWVWQTSYGELHAYHANPFGDVVEGQKNWAYLNHDEQIARAAAILKEGGAKAGVFGHNHRALLARVSGANIEREESNLVFSANDDVTYILNPGSVGQPRSSEKCATYLTIDGGRACLHRVDYDVSEHLRRIDTMNVSGPTKVKLKGFFGLTKAR